MKIIYVLILFTLILLSGCSTKEEENLKANQCIEFGGRWINEAYECVDINSDQCTQLGGVYDECASACRNDPGAEMCIQVCVQACKVSIGGDKDKYGCLVAAGYAWNETIGACARSWELDADQAGAARIAALPMSYRPITIVEVESLRCPGCFRVDMKRGDTEETVSIIIRNGKIDSGYNDVDVTEHICTEEESLATACTMDYNPVCGKIVLNMGDTIYRTFGNGCSACASMKVISYTPGECAADDTTDRCSDQNGNYLTLTEAMAIAKNSECGDNLITDCACPENYAKDGETCNPACYHSSPSAQNCLAPSMQCEKTYVCNEGTGTYWIDLNLTKTGCNPACVVNVEDRTAEINWRCTGLGN